MGGELGHKAHGAANGGHACGSGLAHRHALALVERGLEVEVGLGAEPQRCGVGLPAVKAHGLAKPQLGGPALRRAVKHILAHPVEQQRLGVGVVAQLGAGHGDRLEQQQRPLHAVDAGHMEQAPRRAGGALHGRGLGGQRYAEWQPVGVGAVAAQRGEGVVAARRYGVGAEQRQAAVQA